MNLHVRKATLADCDQLAALFNAYRVFYQKPSDVEAAKRFLTERMERDESVVFVASTPANVLVGFTQLYPLFSSTRMKRLWLLNDLYVSEEFRNLKAGVKLIEKAKEWAMITGACGLTLETAKTNTVGNALYPKMGFSVDSDHNFYSWDVE